MATLPPSRRDTIGPPPRNISDLAAQVRHGKSWQRSVDPGIDGRWSTPRPVKGMGAQVVGDSDGGDGGQDIGFWDSDLVTATAVGRLVLNLTFEPIDGSLRIFWDGEEQLPAEYTLDADALLVTFVNTHIHVGDVLHAAYAYYPTDLVEPDPSGWYRLDESSGIVMVDSSGNGHDGLYGGVTLGQPSLLTDDPDTAAAWNGFSSHSQIPYGPWMDTPAISVNLLVKGVAAGTLVCRDNGTFGHLWVFRIGSIFSGPGTELGLFYGGVGSNWIATTGLNLTDGARHMVGFSYDGVTLKLYADGLLQRSQAVSFPLVGGSVPISVGANEGGTGGSLLDLYAGTLDELRIYPKVLTDTQFADLWGAS